MGQRFLCPPRPGLWRGARPRLVCASTWTITVLVGYSKTKVVETDTEEVQVMRDVLRDARQGAQQLNKQPVVHQSMLSKPWK